MKSFLSFSLALKKVLNFLKSTILKGSGSTIRPSAVSSVVDGMLDQAQEALAIVEKQGNSPKRVSADLYIFIYAGYVVICLKILQEIHDFPFSFYTLWSYLLVSTEVDLGLGGGFCRVPLLLLSWPRQ